MFYYIANTVWLNLWNVIFSLNTKLKYKIINSLSREFMMNTLRPQIKTIFSDLISLVSGPWEKTYLKFGNCAWNWCKIVPININIALININITSIIAY